MKIKTSELASAALDWAVCMAIGLKSEDLYIANMGKKHTSIFRRTRDEDGALDGRYQTGPDLIFHKKWEASGPIIERERMWVCAGASTPDWFAESQTIRQRGPTPLTAAMRCFVASKLGDEVDIPNELI